VSFAEDATALFSVGRCRELHPESTIIMTTAHVVSRTRAYGCSLLSRYDCRAFADDWVFVTWPDRYSVVSSRLL
jgi:hypothetical protein